MYLVAIAWMYVVVMMAIAEAFASNGTVLGAVITLLLYGLLPLSIVLYVMRAPARRTARKAREALEALEAGEAAQSDKADKADLSLAPTATAAASTGSADAGRHAPGDAVAPVGKKA